MTTAEFLALPESEVRMELINGEVFVSPAPELDHQDLVFALGKLIEKVMPDGKIYLSPVDVDLGDGHVLQPDVLWLSGDSQSQSVQGKFLRGAPELVVEVLSPGSVRRDRGEKFDIYQNSGVEEYWLVDPREQYVEVYVLESGRFMRSGLYGPGDSLRSPVIGNAEIKLDVLFT